MVPLVDQDVVLPSAIAEYPVFYKAISIRTRSLVPILPVQTKEERALFIRVISEYVGSALNISTLSLKSDSLDPADGQWEVMARDWNAGTLRHPSGARSSPPPSVSSKILKKLPCHLTTHYRIFRRALVRKVMIRSVKQSLNTLVEELARTINNDDIQWAESFEGVPLFPVADADPRDALPTLALAVENQGNQETSAGTS
jgi:hypothetical protein